MEHLGLSRRIACLGLLVLVAGCSGTAMLPTQTPVSQATPTSLPSSTPEPTPTAVTPEEAQRPLLMAHYMPWYQAPPVSGVWGWHWTMEHFNPANRDENGRRDIASYYAPLTGPYDSSDAAILEYQVLLMKLSGIDGVIVDWYGIEDFWDYGVINESTQELFEAVKRAGLLFAICYEDQTVRFMVENKHIAVGDVYAHGQDVMRYLDASWFGDDAYLKYAGQPLLFLFGPQYFKNAADWETLTSMLDVPPALVTLDKHTESAGIASFPWPPMWAGRDGVLAPEALESYLTGFYQKAERWEYRVAGAFPGFQDIYEEAGVGSSYGYLDPQGGEMFRLTLEMAVAQNPDLIQLITWNDYGEGTIIEPTVEFGYQYLEMVQDTRRATDDAAFPFEAADLRLPWLLLDGRRRYAGDSDVNARLDEAFDALNAGSLDEAAAIIAEYAETP